CRKWFVTLRVRLCSTCVQAVPWSQHGWLCARARTCNRRSCSPSALFDSPLLHKIGGKMDQIFFRARRCGTRVGGSSHGCGLTGAGWCLRLQRTLQEWAPRVGTLIIATDNDREGENIGFEIIECCQQGEGVRGRSRAVHTALSTACSRCPF